nr:hypothetical protein BaRGS_027073 [Batillaria attramentaria]
MMVAQGSMSWKDVLVKTVYNKGQHILAGPVTLDMDAALRWPHAGLMSVPQIVLSLQAGLVLVNLVSGSKEWPDALEIVFSAGEPELGIDSTMTWAYPEPRLITAINTLPVPFSSYLVVNADQVVTVSCQGQMEVLDFSSLSLPSVVEAQIRSSQLHVHFGSSIMHTLNNSLLAWNTILLSPLYVLRSHLPRPLHVMLETGRSKQRQELEVLGQGHETNLPHSSPPVILSSGLVDQVQQADDAAIDLDTLCEDVAQSDMSLTWPYTDLQSARVAEW